MSRCPLAPCFVVHAYGLLVWAARPDGSGLQHLLGTQAAARAAQNRPLLDAVAKALEELQAARRKHAPAAAAPPPAGFAGEGGSGQWRGQPAVAGLYPVPPRAAGIGDVRWNEPSIALAGPDPPPPMARSGTVFNGAGTAGRGAVRPSKLPPLQPVPNVAAGARAAPLGSFADPVAAAAHRPMVEVEVARAAHGGGGGGGRRPMEWAAPAAALTGAARAGAVPSRWPADDSVRAGRVQQNARR